MLAHAVNFPRLPWSSRGCIGALMVVIAAGAAAVPMPPDAVERWFSTGLYPLVQRTVTSITNLLPVAVLDVMLVIAVPAILVAASRVLRISVSRRSFAPVGKGIASAAVIGSAVYLVFLLIWGLNYRRLPMTERLQVSEAPVSAEAVLALGLEAVRQLNDLYAEAHRTGWSGAEWREPVFTASASLVHQELNGADRWVPGRLKRSVVGPYFRWTGVDGMVNPFGLEIIQNPDLLPFERPFVVAHEWAHLAGFADESEANLVGFLTCVRASAPAQYSGWLYLYWQVAGESNASSRQVLQQAMADGPRGDVEQIIERLRRGQRPRMRILSWMVYDQYLKANRVESGIRSYGAVLNLLIRTQFEPAWVPVRRRQP
jgi:hypothetical protein